MKELRSEARAGQQAKIRRLTGSHGTVTDPTGDMAAPGTVQVGPQKDSSIRSNGARPKARLDKPMRASGGRVKPKGTNINIIVGGQKPQPEPVPVPVPPPPVMAKPAAPPAAAPPGGPGAPMGNGPLGPMAGMPMRKRGGRVEKFTGGAASGVGREEKAEHQARKKGAA